MLQYKYQILVDGYSAAWDSSLWKLGSNSTVFYVHPQQHHDGRPHQVGAGSSALRRKGRMTRRTRWVHVQLAGRGE